jgi:hypothetical protein
MIIGVQNLSSLVSGEDAYSMTLLVDRQLREHVAPMWGLAPPTVTFLDKPAEFPCDAIIGILDDADQAGDLGWHSEGPDADVYGRVFASPVLQNGGNALTNELSVCSVLSHECIETLGDAACNRWAQRADGSWVAVELADPVEGDSYEITIAAGAIKTITGTVSDFVLPAWFDPDASTARTDWMILLNAPFQARDTGYVITMAAGSTTVTEQWGDRYPEWKKAVKAASGSRTSVRDAQLTTAFKPPTALA